jgi:hypothetical protein
MTSWRRQEVLGQINKAEEKQSKDGEEEGRFESSYIGRCQPSVMTPSSTFRNPKPPQSTYTYSDRPVVILVNLALVHLKSM